MVMQSQVHYQAHNLDAGRGTYLFPFDAYRHVHGLTTIPGEVDGGGLVPFEGRATPTLPLRRLSYDHLEAIYVLCGGLACRPSCVVIDKSVHFDVLIDTVLHEICVKEKQQDWRQEGTLWQSSLFKCAQLGCLAVHHNRRCAFGANDIDPVHQLRWDASSREPLSSLRRPLPAISQASTAAR